MEGIRSGHLLHAANGDKSDMKIRKTLFRSLIESLGFCCPYAFIRAARGQSGAIAAHLGITRRSYAMWKKKYRLRQISCDQCDNCELERPRDWYPPKLMAQRRILPSDRDTDDDTGAR